MQLDEALQGLVLPAHQQPIAGLGCQGGVLGRGQSGVAEISQDRGEGVWGPVHAFARVCWCAAWTLTSIWGILESTLGLCGILGGRVDRCENGVSPWDAEVEGWEVTSGTQEVLCALDTQGAFRTATCWQLIPRVHQTC